MITEENRQYQRKWYLKNKEEIQKRQKKWYKKHKKEHKARGKEYHKKYRGERNIEQRKRRKETTQWFHTFKKNLKCSQCDEGHPACLDFHHLNPKMKSGNISRMINQGYKINRILTEIAKCMVLCKNCHAKLHYREKKNEVKS